MRVLITGAAGFIGSHLVKYHLKLRDEVWGLDNLVTGSLESLSQDNWLDHPNLRFERADLLTTPSLSRAVNWADRIYHMAALLGLKRVFQHPFEVLSQNIQGCERLLLTVQEEVMRGKQEIQVLIASSSCVYGSGKEVVGKKEEEPMTVLSGFYPQEAYTASKVANELTGLCLCSKLPQVHLVIARFFNVIGPYQTGKYGMVVPSLVLQALKKEPMTVYGTGKQTRSFCHIQDAIEACQRAFLLPRSQGEIFNIGSPEEISILHLAEKILAKIKIQSVSKLGHSTHAKIIFLPYEDGYQGRFSETLRRVPCIQKLTKLTGFTPQISLDEALDEIITFYQNSHKISP
ncbi:MAG: NAD-dependent epimerase/dehydratase family protein [Chlamydiae bacterium]|nr:NAD-dependent epimerase/dehydratase family protein [Chlamydiota bacterium]